MPASTCPQPPSMTCWAGDPARPPTGGGVSGSEYPDPVENRHLRHHSESHRAPDLHRPCGNAAGAAPRRSAPAQRLRIGTLPHAQQMRPELSPRHGPVPQPRLGAAHVHLEQAFAGERRVRYDCRALDPGLLALPPELGHRARVHRRAGRSGHVHDRRPAAPLVGQQILRFGPAVGFLLQVVLGARRSPFSEMVFIPVSVLPHSNTSVPARRAGSPQAGAPSSRVRYDLIFSMPRRSRRQLLHALQPKTW